MKYKFKQLIAILLITSVGHDIVVMRTFHCLIRHKDIMTGAAYASRAPEFTSGFIDIHVVLSFVSPYFML